MVDDPALTTLPRVQSLAVPSCSLLPCVFRWFRFPSCAGVLSANTGGSLFPLAGTNKKKKIYGCCHSRSLLADSFGR